MQKLIQPMNHMLVGMGFKSPLYYQRGIVKTASGVHMEHYGADWWSATGDKVLWAMGDGVVLAAGRDSTFGNAVVIRYNEAFNHRTGVCHDVIVRCFHLASIRVKPGDKVTKDTRVGVIGCTGKHCNGIHLHIEVSTDVDDPMGVPAIATTNMFHWVTKQTPHIQDPAAFVHTKISAPDNQIVKSAGSWYRDRGRDGDFRFPKIKEVK